jgi:hypothetical protein
MGVCDHSRLAPPHKCESIPEDTFDALVRDEPDGGDQSVDRACEIRCEERRDNPNRVQQWRHSAFPVPTDCLE